jgi:hypothetical protein
LWEFGGFTQYADRHILLNLGTYALIEMSRKIERGEVEEAYGDLVQRLLDSVQDKELQHRVAARIGRHASLCLEAV